MKTRCRRFQVAWMEALDEGRMVPAEVSAHLDGCADCRTWVQYLEAERQAVARWTPPTVSARAWVPALIRPPSARRLAWAWSLAGLVLVGLGLGLWWTVYRPQPLRTDADMTDTVTFWMEGDVLSDVPDTEEIPSYLERSGLWWTEADLQALEQGTTSSVRRTQPLESTAPHRTGYGRLTV
jgi:hypothetical protein